MINKKVFAKNTPLIWLLLLLISYQTLHAQNFQEIIKAVANDAAADDEFGYSVAISGDYAIVGAYLDDDGGTDSGSAYIFQKDHGGTDNWGQIKKVTANDAAASDWFGSNVAISGDYAIVGAIFGNSGGMDSGSAYIFQKDHGGTDNWGQIKKVVANDAAIFDFFGSSVAISGDNAIVGASFDDDGGMTSGSAYIFQKDHGGTDNWGQIKKVVANDAEVEDYFGSNVSISGDYAIVGAHLEDDGGTDSGSAYIFQKDHGGADNWGQIKKVTANDAAANDSFGSSLAISGDYAIVGASKDDDGGTDSGSAYIFQKNHGAPDNWGQIKKVTASDPAPLDFFGGSVSISGNYIIVGASSDDDGGTNSGSTYIFQKDEGGTDNWGQTKKIVASDAASQDFFGSNVFISGNYAIVGAYKDNDGGTDSGSAYILKNCLFPVVYVSLNTPTLSENAGQDFEFQFSRDCPMSEVTVYFSIGGNVSSSDYTVQTGGTGMVVYDMNEQLWSITFPDGETTVDLVIEIENDNVVEETKQLVVSLEEDPYFD